MCVPCAKEIINNGATAAADDASLIRELIVNQAIAEGDRPLSKEEEALLLRMAKHEAQFILAIRQCRTQMIAIQGSPPEWVDLARSLE